MKALTQFFKFFGLALILVSLVFVVWQSIQAVDTQDFTDIFLGLGLALFGGVPGAILFVTARHIGKNGPSRGSALTAFIFSLPLLLLGFWLFYMPHITIWLAIIVCASAAMAALWGGLIWRRISR